MEQIKTYSLRKSSVREMTDDDKKYYRIDECVDAEVILNKREQRQFRLIYADNTCSYPSMDFDCPLRVGDHVDPERLRVCVSDSGFASLTTRRVTKD